MNVNGSLEKDCIYVDVCGAGTLAVHSRQL